MAQHEITIIARFINKVTAPLKAMNKTVEKAVKTFRQIRGGLMGISFALMFGGMALNRFFTKAIESAIEAYKMMGAEQSVFNVKTNELAAAWTFFKFSLIDALSQSPLFITLIDSVINLINWFNKLPVGVKQLMAIGLAAGWLTTKIASIVGQISLFVISIELVKPGAILSLVGAFTKLTVAMLANPWTWIIIGIMAIILLVGYCVKTFDSFGNTLKFFGGFAIWLFALIGDAIIESLLFPIRVLIKVINAAIVASNALFGTKWKTINVPEELRPGMLTRKAESYLAGASWFQPSAQDVQEKGTFKDYAVGLVKEITEGLADAVTSGMDKSLEKNKVMISAPNT